jgi:hypothetical protein
MIKQFLTFLYTGDYVVSDPEPIHTSDMQNPIKEDANRLDDLVEADAVSVNDTAAEGESGSVEAGEDWL